MADQHQALYRRYRSKRFGEQVGQAHVMRALRSAVQEDRVGHAYLFSGPRGTGKTSTARILAKVLNCENPEDGEPCGICENCRAVDEGRIVDWLPAGVRPVGFLDEGTVAWLAPTWGYLDWKEKAVLVIADLSTDRVLRELEVPHPPTMTVTAVQLGSTEGLTGHAAARGFS